MKLKDINKKVRVMGERNNLVIIDNNFKDNL